MANYSKTVSNSLRLFGVAPSSKWGAYNWNAFIWGEGTTDLTTIIEKWLSNAVTPSSTVSISLFFAQTISNTLSVTSDMGSETLTDGAGYNYVIGNASELEDRSLPNWTDQTRDTETYTTVSNASTTWSNA